MRAGPRTPQMLFSSFLGPHQVCVYRTEALFVSSLRACAKRSGPTSPTAPAEMSFFSACAHRHRGYSLVNSTLCLFRIRAHSAASLVQPGRFSGCCHRWRCQAGRTAPCSRRMSSSTLREPGQPPAAASCRTSWRRENWSPLSTSCSRPELEPLFVLPLLTWCANLSFVGNR